MYLSDHQYFFSSADPGEYDRLSQPVWQPRANGDRRPALVITLATTLVAVVFCRAKQGCGVLTRGKQDEETCERRVQNIKIPERELRIDGTPRGGRL